MKNIVFLLSLLFLGNLPYAAAEEALPDPAGAIENMSAIDLDSLAALLGEAASLSQISRVELSDEGSPSHEEGFPESDALLHAFLNGPTIREPLLPTTKLLSCTGLRAEKRRMQTQAREMEKIRRMISSQLDGLKRSVKMSSAKMDSLRRNQQALREVVTLLQAYVNRINEAAPERVLTYNFKLYGPRANSLRAYYRARPAVQLLRVQFAGRPWREFPTEAFSVHGGFLEAPELLGDGQTWRVRRALNAYRACTMITDFALDFLTRWEPLPGTPGSAARGVTVRAHTWEQPAK